MLVAMLSWFESAWVWLKGNADPLNALIGSAMLIVTATAIWIAVWSARYPHKKKLRVKSSYCINATIIPPLESKRTKHNVDTRTIVVTAENIGFRNIKIKAFGLTAKTRRKHTTLLYCLGSTFMRSAAPGIDELPKTLNSQESIECLYDFDMAIKHMQDVRPSVRKSRFKLKAFVEDSLGTRYYSSVKHDDKYIEGLFTEEIKSTFKDTGRFNLTTLSKRLIKFITRERVLVEIVTFDNNVDIGTAKLKTGEIVPIVRADFVREREANLLPGHKLTIFI